MAIVWQHQEGKTRYEVRSAGTTLRLYTNGAFHSQHNPRHLFTGGIWDLLAVPACYINAIHEPRLQTKVSSRHSPKPSSKPSSKPPSNAESKLNFLVLGVGGGAAIHLYNQLFGSPPITGIEYDRVHLDIARRFFKCDTPNARLVDADAYQWITTNTEKFSVILDDLFVDGPNDPIRPRAVNRQWIKRLHIHLKKDGLLIQNHLSPATARTVAQDSWVREHFKRALLFHHPMYANGILALYKTEVDIQTGRESVKKRVSDIHIGALKRLKYRTQTLF